MKKMILLIMAIIILPCIVLADSYDVQVGSKKYNSHFLSDYFALAELLNDGDTIKILNENNWDYLHLQSNMQANNITVDLNGKEKLTLYLDFPREKGQNSYGYGQTTWTFIDTSQGKTSSITIIGDKESANNTSYRSANIKMSGFDISKYTFDSNGINEAIFTDCFFNGENVAENKSKTINGPVITKLNGGTYKGIKITSATPLSINGGTYTGVKFENSSTLTVVNGEFKSYLDGNVENVFSNKSIATLNINGGTFKLNDDKLFNNSGTVNITGGDFRGQCGLFSNGGTLTISNGTFNNEKKEGEAECTGTIAFSNSGTATISGETSITADNQLFYNSSMLNINGGTLKTTTNGLAFSSTGSNSKINFNGGTIEGENATRAIFTKLACGNNDTTIYPDLNLKLNNVTYFGPEANSTSKAYFYFHKGVISLKSKIDKDHIIIAEPSSEDDVKIQYVKDKNETYQITLVPKDTPDPREYFLGDWNLDEKLDGTDLTLYRKYLANMDPDIEITEGDTKKYSELDAMHKSFLDVTNDDDDKINLADLVKVRLMIADQESN